MISASIKKLVEYGLEKGLIQKEDEIYTINRLLEVMGEQEYRQKEADNGKKDCCLEDILKDLLDEAAKKGLLEHDSVVYRDLFDTKLMTCLTPRPS